MLLLDTAILIDFLRGYPPALEFLRNLPEEAAISVLNVAEIMAGKKANHRDEDFLRELALRHDVFPVDYEIATQGGLLFRQYGYSHGSGIMDCMLAATAQIKDCKLVTHNAKHFPMINVMIPYAKA